MTPLQTTMRTDGKSIKPPTQLTPKPWDRPTLPLRGSATEEEVFIEVGRALSAWERLETQLANIFALLVARDSGDMLVAQRTYESVVTFRGRSDMLLAANRAVFWRKPEAPMPVALEDHITEAGNFAARRNEIAHGIVEIYQPVPAFTDAARGFALMPPIYARAKNKLEEGPFLAPVRHSPVYAYTATELLNFTAHFKRLGEDASAVSITVLRHIFGIQP